MINILLNDEYLDLYSDTNISLSWTTFRFSKSLKDQYTNNFTIPKTNKNVKILGIYSLLDEGDIIQFGDKLKHAIFQIDDKLINVFIQIVSISDTEIEICLYEDGFPAIEKDKTINDDFVDDNTTIYRWNKYSMTDYPDAFKKYDYGFDYNYKLAQRHPSIKIDDLFKEIDLKGYTMQANTMRDSWRVLSSRKIVCPQNKTQVLESNIDFKHSLEGGYLYLAGGQHITNDACKTANQKIKFNRDCTVQMDVYIAWATKDNYNNDSLIEVQVNGSRVRYISIFSRLHKQDYHKTGLSWNFKKDDEVSFYFPDFNKYISVSMVFALTISDYEITNQDYDTELEYTDRFPRINVVKKIVPNIEYTYFDFDGGVNPFVVNERFPRLSFSYFGLLANIPKIKLGDLLYSMQWLMGGKLKIDENKKILSFDNIEYKYDSTNEKFKPYSFVLDNIITASDVLGQKNYIDYKDNVSPIEIVNIDNKWLQKENIFHEVCFNNFLKNEIKQYSLEVNPDNNEVSVKFTDYNNPIIFNHIPNVGAEKIPLQTFGMDRIYKSKEVDFYVYGTTMNLLNTDTLYVDGRTYYIISGDIDIKNSTSRLRTILISTPILNIIEEGFEVRRDPRLTIGITFIVQSSTPLTDITLYYRKIGVSVNRPFTSTTCALTNNMSQTKWFSSYPTYFTLGDTIEYYIEAKNNNQSKSTTLKQIQL